MNYSKNDLVPHYQPIIAIDSNSIYGFDVIDYYKKDNVLLEVDYNRCSDECEMEYSRIIRKKALESFSKLSISQYLFIKMKMCWIEDHKGNPSDLPLISFATQCGIDLSKLVLEIPQDEFNNCTDKCFTYLSCYRSAGIKIAISEYGKTSASTDILIMFTPDIIKIDESLVQKSENFYQYREYMNIIIEFAQKLGIEVTYVGVENENQLDECMRFQGRYYQGNLLSGAIEEMNHAVFNDQVFKFSTYKSIANHQLSAVETKKIHNSLNNAINNFFNIKPYDNYEIDSYLSELSMSLPSNVVRVYVCNKYGYQTSSNIELGSMTVSLVNYRNRNWSWRKYFVDALKVIVNEQESHMSDEYRDVTTKDKLYTFIRKISEDEFLIIDILKYDN